MSAHLMVRAADSAAVETLSTTLELPRFIAAAMVSRGIDTLEKAQRYLNPSLDRDWHNPYDLPVMQEVVDVLIDAVTHEKTILVFGDFDLDGISATALMTRGLRHFGAQVVPFIPLRFEEGYGLTQASIERALTYKPDVVITVDNGIAAKEEVKLLVEAGVQVLITDHHEPSEMVPEGVPVLDPKCCHCPSDILSGAGVALKVVQALGGALGEPHYWRELVDLATLGTVADLMPMRDENRALVARGVDMLNNEPRLCISALLAESGNLDKPLSASSLSFTLIPRLNAAGRMGNAQLALDLLLSDSFEEASVLAHQLEENNNRRRVIEAELTEVAEEMAQRIYDNQRALVVAGKDWHEGVKGIVAARLANRFGVPAILFTIEGDQARGSGRSVGEINLFKAVESCSDLLSRFGGHEAAVGVTLPAANLPAFYERLCAYMDTLPAESFIPRIKVDATVDLGELTRANVEKLAVMEPFGQENPAPKFLAHSVSLAYSRAVGADKNHLACTFSDGTHSLEGIMFHCPNINAITRCSSTVDAVFELEIDTWRGRKSVKAIISSLTPVQPCEALVSSLPPENRRFMKDLLGSNRKEWQPSFLSDDALAHDAQPAAPLEQARVHWEDLAQRDPASLRAQLVEAFIGDKSLHAAQEQILDMLDAGESVLGIMGTGRGKSLIFHIHAVELALTKHAASVFVYPLRALIADQAYHLRQALERFGINVAVLNGDTPDEERAYIMKGLTKHQVDIVLTTPEYLRAHLDDFSTQQLFDFAVVDEAHHVALSKAGYRPAYTQLGDTLRQLGIKEVLALTATATAPIAEEITDVLGITRHVFDEQARVNLHLQDKRGIKKRERYLANLLSQGEKTIIYVNSRLETVNLTRSLRRQLPHMAPLIGFYNAGMTREERTRVEDLFRKGELLFLLATSAFGEGVNIPDVRHVVLYHLPFSEVEFNQMSGRAGRDGNDAHIHLLFDKQDNKINSSIMNNATPERDIMAQIYRELRAMQREHPGNFFTIDFEELAKRATKLLPSFTISSSQVSCGIAVFQELGLINVRSQGPGCQHPCKICVVEVDGKVELHDSIRYQEGMSEIDSFNRFSKWVFKTSEEALIERIRKPLIPDA